MHAARPAIQRSQAPLATLSRDLGINRFHDNHSQLRTHLADFKAGYNFAHRLKTLGGLTPYDYICRI